MTCPSKPQIDTKLNDTITNFLAQYGTSGLKQALQLYKNTQQEYICKTRTSISKLRISDIYYMEIREHQITSMHFNIQSQFDFPTLCLSLFLFKFYTESILGMPLTAFHIK